MSLITKQRSGNCPSSINEIDPQSLKISTSYLLLSPECISACPSVTNLPIPYLSIAMLPLLHANCANEPPLPPSSSPFRSIIPFKGHYHYLVMALPSPNWFVLRLHPTSATSLSLCPWITHRNGRSEQVSTGYMFVEGRSKEQYSTITSDQSTTLSIWESFYRHNVEAPSFISEKWKESDRMALVCDLFLLRHFYFLAQSKNAMFINLSNTDGKIHVKAQFQRFPTAILTATEYPAFLISLPLSCPYFGTCAL